MISIFTNLKREDIYFWKNLHLKHKKYLNELNLNPNSFCFYGEILFFIIGLRKLVMFSNFSRDLQMDYIEKVLKKVDLDKYVQYININTENYVSENEMVLWKEDKKELESIFKEKKQLESTVGYLLDYPIFLPEIEELNDIMDQKTSYQICEIGYFDGKTLIMSFGSRNTKEDLQKVKNHFENYKIKVKEFIDLRMDMLVL